MVPSVIKPVRKGISVNRKKGPLSELSRRAYQVNSTVTITKWIKEFKRENAELVASNLSVMTNKKQNQQPDPDSKKALAEALKKLEEAELKVKALNTLIDVAEEQFKISIRKKA